MTSRLKADPAIGHRYNELARAGDSDDTLLRLRDFIFEAVKWLVDAGELERVEVEVGRFAPGTFFYEARYFPPGREPIESGKQLVSVGAD